MSQVRLAETMKEAGFSDTLIVIYGFLLTQEQATIIEVSRAIKLDAETIQREVKSLLQLQVVAFDSLRGKYVLFALDPVLVWSAFIKGRTWQFIQTLGEDDIEPAIISLPDDHQAALRRFRTTINAIQLAASALYQGSYSVTGHRWRDAIDQDQMGQLLAQAIQRAKSTIQAASASPRLPHVALIWESILSKVKNKVAYRRVADFTEIVEHGLDVIRRDIEVIGIDLRVLDTADITKKFYLIDSALVVVFHSVGLSNDGSAIGRVTDQAQIISRYKGYFSNHYSNAIPGQFVLSQLTESGERLLQNARSNGYSSDVLEWLECLIGWGTFCNKSSAGLDVKKAIRDNFVHIGTTGKLVPSYDIDMGHVRLKWQSRTA